MNLAQILLLVLALLLTSAAHADVHFLDGNKLKDYADARNRIAANRPRQHDWTDASALNGYIAGVVDALGGITLCPNKGIALLNSLVSSSSLWRSILRIGTSQR